MNVKNFFSLGISYEINRSELERIQPIINYKYILFEKFYVY